MTNWLKIMAEHYPSLIVSGVCHKVIAQIEELECENGRLRTFVSDAGYSTVCSEQAWKVRAEKAERSLANAESDYHRRGCELVEVVNRSAARQIALEKAIAQIEELEAALAKSGCSDYFCNKVGRDCHACPVKMS